jgi:hypothetical protein
VNRSHAVRALSTAVLIGAATAGGLTLTMAGSASASGPQIKCSTVKGNLSSTVKLSHCNGNTGGASMALMPDNYLSGPGVITWVNGEATTVSLTSISNGAQGTCPAGTTEYNVAGTVTADTTGSAPVGGKLKASVCLHSTGAITIRPGTVVSFK